MPKIKKWQQANGILVCCWCHIGGNKEKGPLRKIDVTNYAHDDCFRWEGKPGDPTASLKKFKSTL